MLPAAIASISGVLARVFELKQPGSPYPMSSTMTRMTFGLSVEANSGGDVADNTASRIRFLKAPYFPDWLFFDGIAEEGHRRVPESTLS